jgi:hypothetical protein
MKKIVLTVIMYANLVVANDANSTVVVEEDEPVIEKILQI